MFSKKQKEVADQSTKSEKSVHSFDDAIRAISPSTLSAVAGVTALIGAIKGLSSVFGSALNNYAHFEKMEMGLKTFFQDADKGSAKFEELRKLSNETTYGVDELTDSFTQLANVGVNVDTIKDKLIMLGNVAQGDKVKFAELTSIYAKINSTGKAGAMQLQQIASRGIPIYDMLKKIGVQGTATASDITKAFQEMTKEGGQFYNAMNNINETIEGKEGFISDYFKEFTVNFAEVTGLADAYKAVLDTLKDTIGALSDKLLEWNENPFMKALISGVLVASLTAIGGVIATSIIPKLVMVIKHLITINLLQGAKGWAVLAVAGITGVATAYVQYAKSTEKATQETKKLYDAQVKLQQASSHNNMLRSVGILPTDDSRQSKYNKKSAELESFKNGVAEVQEKLNKANEEMRRMQENADALGYGVEMVEGYEELNNQIQSYTNGIERANKLIELQERELKNLTNEMQKFTDLANMGTEFESIHDSLFGETDDSIQKQLDAVNKYKQTLEELNGHYDNNGQLIRFDDKTRNAIDETVRYLENKLKGVSAWEDVFKSVTGIAIPKAGSGNKTRGQLAGEDYIARMNKLYEAQVKAEQTVGTKNASSKVAEEMVKTIENQLKNLISNIDVDQPFEETDATIKAMVASMENFKTMIDDTTEVIERSFTSLSDVADYLMNLATGKDENGNYINSRNTRLGAYAGAMAINGAQGSNAGDIASGAIQGFEIGGVIGAIVGALVALAMKTKTVTDALEDLNGIIDPLLRAVNAILKPITSIAKVIINVLSPILEALATVIEKVFDFFFGWLNDYADSTREASEEKQKEIERLRAITDAYSNMLTTLREVEEEYERRRKQINAQTYNESVTGVHDMILTPQGKFSTDPDDYIIATKNPNNLNNRGGVPNVIVNNYTNDTVETRTDDDGNIILLISQKVALDYAQGNNGWDNAVMARQARMAGRNLAM